MIRRVVLNTLTGHRFIETFDHLDWRAVQEAFVADATEVQPMSLDQMNAHLAGFGFRLLGVVTWRRLAGVAALNRELARVGGSGNGSNTDYAGAATDAA